MDPEVKSDRALKSLVDAHRLGEMILESLKPTIHAQSILPFDAGIHISRFELAVDVWWAELPQEVASFRKSEFVPTFRLQHVEFYL